MLDNPEMAKKLGDNGKIRMEKYFSSETFADESISIYRNVISKSLKSRIYN